MNVPSKNAVPVTAELGRWVSELRFADLPSRVVAHLKLCLLDGIGCGLFGALQPWGKIAGDIAVSFSGGGPSQLFARGETVGPADAAMANGTAIHGYEIDDAHVTSSLHPGAVTIPATLALANRQEFSGESFLTSLAAGYEAGLRVGICAGVSHSTSGFHVTGTAGTFCSGAAAASALNLSPGQAMHALGIAGTQAGGLYSAREGAMTKRFHAGRAAQSGVLAACLAQAGFTGSDQVIEAPFGGFMSAMHGQSDPATILDGLGTSWETENVGFKIYAACASAHTIIDSILALRDRGLTAENLEALTIRMSKKGALNVGWSYVPGDTIAAQMNGSYAAAVTLLDGAAFIDQYADHRLVDPCILGLLPRITIAHDPELDRGGAAKRHAVRVEALPKSGDKQHITVEQRKGSADWPLSVADIENKFRTLAGRLLSHSEIDEMIDIIGTLERQSDLSRLTTIFSRPSVAHHNASAAPRTKS